MMRTVLARAMSCGIAILLATSAAAVESPYDESADAKQEIGQALLLAATAKVPVLVVFGANWCGDCKVLDIAMKSGASAPLIQRDFKVVKVDVGRYDRNLGIAESYGVPLKKGIPAVVVLSSRNEVVYATRGGELADARNMGESGIHEFFRRASAAARP